MLRVLILLLVVASAAGLLWWAFKPVYRLISNQRRAVTAAKERKKAALLRLEAVQAEAEAQRLEREGDQVLEKVFKAQMSHIKSERSKE